MSGRGRPRKAKSPESKPANNITRSREEQQPPTRCPAITKEKQKETTDTKKARDQKNLNHIDEMPCAHNNRKGKTTNHATVETNKPNGASKERTKAKTGEKSAEEAENTPPDTPKEPAKKCAGRAKSPGSMSAKNATRSKKKQDPPITCPAFTEKQDETIKNQKVKETNEKPSAQKTGKEKTLNHDIEETNEQHGVPTVRTKAKTCSTKTKTGEKSAWEAENTSPCTPQVTAKNSKVKKCAGDAKIPEESAEKTAAPQERLEGNSETRGDKAKAAQALPEEKVNSILKETLYNLRIKKKERSDTSGVVNEITKLIIDHLKKTESFKDVKEPLRTGSYYENLKISDPDEFDVMLPIPVERVGIDRFGDDGAFYSVALKRGNNPLKKFQKDDVLSASEMLDEFREEVKKCVKLKEWSMERKKKGCPAVTMTREVGSILISLDVVLCLEVKSSWPAFTKDGLNIERWLGTKVKQEYKREPYYLVPKYEGNGKKEKDGVCAKDVWRVSFSHIEKAILKNHGSEKTCCEREGPSCCRKDCLKLLKHLLHLLKEKNEKKFDKVCSYHAKTTLLHACCSRPKDSNWMASDLSRCFQLLLQDFEDRLKKAELHNFFIPSQNLLSGPSSKMCKELADCIKEQREKGFPIFEEELRKQAA